MSYDTITGVHNVISNLSKILYGGPNMAKRVNLSIEDDLFALIENDANGRNCTVNVHIITLLEKLYKPNPFDYVSALNTLETEAKQRPINQEFTLVDLPSFTQISVAKAQNADLKPSVVRARLGKMFNSRVSEGKVGTVVRSKDSKGNLKFVSRTAVYERQ